MAKAKKDNIDTVTLYLTGARTGTTVGLGSFKRYQFTKGELSVPRNSTGAIKVLRKYYGCSLSKPEVVEEKPAVAKPAATKPATAKTK